MFLQFHGDDTNRNDVTFNVQQLDFSSDDVRIECEFYETSEWNLMTPIVILIPDWAKRCQQSEENIIVSYYSYSI
jgi:hypothetical protein